MITTSMSRCGVLLIQLGTPDAPTTKALRRYLRQFLSDRRVIEMPRWRWWFILHLFVLRTRPRQSALKYQRIWDPQSGSPLLHITRLQAESLAKQLPNAMVRFGMQVGNPSVEAVVSGMIAQGIERLVVLPMYPQYSATTTASATDALFQALMRQRRVPAVRIVPPYFDHPAYLDAMATIIQADVAKLGWRPDHHVLSFHGLPVSYVERGDPYPSQVQRTTLLLIDRLGWPPGSWSQTYQSLFGRDRWLEPYTDLTLRELAARGQKRVFVAMPGFTADCLETLDEIGHEAKLAFASAGGLELRACPCLNDNPCWIQAMQAIVMQEAGDWLA